MILKDFLDNVRILKKGKLIVSVYNDTVHFHVSGRPQDAVKRECEYCSPNAVADICINLLGVDLTSDEVVEISNFC